MNKYKVLGIAQMIAIILAIGSAHIMGFTSIQWALSGSVNFLLYVAGLSIILFGSFSALTLDNLK